MVSILLQFQRTLYNNEILFIGPDGQHIGSDDEQNTLHGENRSGNGAEADTTAGISDIVA